MLKVHMSNGLTHEVDLSDERQFKGWLDRFHDPDWQERIRGLTVVQKGVQYSVPRPSGFGQTTLAAEPLDLGKGGERIVLVTRDAKLNVVIHNGQRAARISLEERNWRKIGGG